ncbi:hypothetical protein Nepgr_026217 [Nepenthes gracilis]|uniref:Uncharacterized protein n=1 Tax=Nepenthes gracilis TaxID=150966 RepID=A0AAD3Y1V6_NEPGR|nr:hypothetical protein Nepgr_026217 [Nepenthes gracilis]
MCLLTEQSDGRERNTVSLSAPCLPSPCFEISTETSNSSFASRLQAEIAANHGAFGQRFRKREPAEQRKKLQQRALLTART